MKCDLERREASRILDSAESDGFLLLVRKLPPGIRNCMFADRYLSSNYSRRVASEPTILKRVTKKSFSVFRQNMSKRKYFTPSACSVTLELKTAFILKQICLSTLWNI